MFGITLPETDKLIKVVLANYQLDLSEYSLNLLRYKIRKFLDDHYLKSVNILINHLLEDDLSYDEFLYGITNCSTEMFRDPSMWFTLRTRVLTEISENPGPIIIWLPRCVSGDELFSLAIILSELKLTKKSVVHASSLSFKSLDIIRSGFFKKDKFTTSNENYHKSGGNEDLGLYFKKKDTHFVRDTSLIGNVSFKRQNHNFPYIPKNINLLLFRNQLLSYNPTLKNKVLNRANDYMAHNAILITGDKESLDGCDISKSYILIHKEEKIYKKVA